MQGSLGEWRQTPDSFFLCWAVMLTDAEWGSVGILLPVGWESSRWELILLALPGLRARCGLASLVGCQPGHQQEFALLLPPRLKPSPPAWDWLGAHPDHLPPGPPGVGMFVASVSSISTFLFFFLSLKGRFCILCQCRTMTYPIGPEGSNLQIYPNPSSAEQFVLPTHDSCNGRKRV